MLPKVFHEDTNMKMFCLLTQRRAWKLILDDFHIVRNLTSLCISFIKARVAFTDHRSAEQLTIAAVSLVPAIMIKALEVLKEGTFHSVSLN